MIVDLGAMQERESTFELRIPPENIDLETENLRLGDEVLAELTVALHHSGANVSGKISAYAEIDCTRCLEPIPQKLEIDVDASFVCEADFPSEANAEVAAADLSSDVVVNDTIDLLQLVREQVLLAVPEQVFCSEDCHGLCEQCGSNLNLIDCNCKDSDIDPRWAALQGLK
jgi:uncharacterized protein